MGSRTKGCCGWLIVALVLALVATAAVVAIMKQKPGKAEGAEPAAQDAPRPRPAWGHKLHVRRRAPVLPGTEGCFDPSQKAFDAKEERVLRLSLRAGKGKGRTYSHAPRCSKPEASISTSWAHGRGGLGGGGEAA